jgi:hypothetical protein
MIVTSYFYFGLGVELVTMPVYEYLPNGIDLKVADKDTFPFSA